MPKRATLSERFWEKVNTESASGCWEWTGAIKKSNGYGLICLPGNNHRQVYAHRLSAMFHFGMFDRRALVCHHCDVRHCVNPAHLYIGDQKSNAQDMVARGRGRGQFPAGHVPHNAPKCNSLAGSNS